MKKALIAAVLVGFLAFLTPASAAVFLPGQNPSLPVGQNINTNVYTAGSNVSVGSAIAGDLFMAGSSLVQTGRVGEDLFAAGGNVNIQGEVGDDLRAVGGNLVVNSKIGGEAMVAGGQVELAPSSSVGKDLYGGGGTFILSGTVSGNVKIGGQKVELNGVVNGNVSIKANELVIGENAVVKGTLDYSSPNKSSIPSSAKIGAVKYTQIEQQPNRHASRAGATGAFTFFRIIAGLIVALIIFAIFRKGTTALVLESFNNFWTKVLTGFVTLIVLPVAMIMVAITVVGIPVSFAAGLVYILFSMASCLGASVAFGTWLMSLRHREKHPRYTLTWTSIVVGIILLPLLSLIPFFGWLLNFVFFLAFFGTLWTFAYRGIRQAR